MSVDQAELQGFHERRFVDELGAVFHAANVVLGGQNSDSDKALTMGSDRCTSGELASANRNRGTLCTRVATWPGRWAAMSPTIGVCAIPLESSAVVHTRRRRQPAFVPCVPLCSVHYQG